jgi:MFS family permease
MIWCKNLYPESQRGQLEGVRLVFYVLVPMISGPVIAEPIVENLGIYIEQMEQNGAIQPGYTPSWHLFIIAAAVALLTLIPIIGAWYYQKKHPETLYITSNATEEVAEG